jgi:hypothetical protein
MSENKRVILIDVNLTTDKLVKNIVVAQKEVDKLRLTNVALKKELATAVGDASINKITKSIVENEAALRSATGELKNYQKQQDNVIKQNKAEEGSYEKLLRTYNDAEVKLKLLKNTVKQNADGTFVLTKEYTKQQAEVLKLKDGLLKFNEGIKDGRLNVGNYAASFKDAFANSGLFGQSLGALTQLTSSVSSGLKLVSDGTKLVGDGFNKAKDVVTSFSVSGSSIGSTFTTLNDGVQETTENTEQLGDAVVNTKGEVEGLGNVSGGLKSKFSSFVSSAITGLRGIATAVAATGIGLLLIAVGSLIAYFTKFQSGIDKLAQVTAGLSAAFDVFVGVIGNVGKALSTLDFTNIGKSFDGLGSKIADATNKAIELEKRKQALERQDIKNISIQGELQRSIEDLITVSENKTKTDQERIDAIKKAGEQETLLAQNQLKQEKESLAIQDASIKLRREAGEVNNDLLKQREQQAEVVAKLEDKIGDQERDSAARSSKLQKSLNNERITAQIGILNNQLALEQLYGQTNFDLQRDIAKKERDAALEDSSLNDVQRLKIQSDYQLKLATIQKAAADEEQKLNDTLTEARLENMVDGKTKELAIESNNLRLKLDAIKGNSIKEDLLRAELVKQSADKLLEIELKYAQLSITERQKINDSNANILLSENERYAKLLQQNLDIQLSQRLLTEEDYANKSAELEAERLQKQLDIQLLAAANRIAAEKLYFDSLEQNAETQKARAEQELITEQELATQIQATVDAINQQRVTSTVNANNRIDESNKKNKDAQIVYINEVANSTKALFSSIGDLLSTDAKNRKKYAGVIKALSTGEVLISGVQEIAGYWEGAGKDAGSGGNLVTGTSSTILAILRTAAAVARTTAGIVKINAQPLAEGGYTMVNGIQSKYSSTIADGGYQRGAVYGQIGERGTEYVAPNWQINQAPLLFESLNRWRTSGVKQFAGGGFTGGSVSTSLIDTSSIVEAALSRSFASMPQPVVAVTEINTVQNRVSVIESRSNL